MQSVANNDVKGVNFFIKINPSEIDKKNIGGATALHIAVRNNNIEIVKILLKFNSDINIIDNEGYSPLMRAVIYGNFEISEMILKRNPNLAILNKNSESVIIQSAISSCNKCLELIISKIIPDYNFDIILLKNQLKQAFIIAAWKNNQIQKQILLEFLEKLSKRNHYQKELQKINNIDATAIKTSKTQSNIKYKLNKPKENLQNSNKTIYIFKKGEEKKYRNKKTQYKLKSTNVNYKKPNYRIKKNNEEILNFKPKPNSNEKTLILDGKNIISQDFNGEVEMKNNEVEKTFIIE